MRQTLSVGYFRISSDERNIFKCCRREGRALVERGALCRHLKTLIAAIQDKCCRNVDRRGGEGRRRVEVGGGPCVRLVLPWSGSSPAIEAAGRQNRAGGGTHRGTEAAAAFALPPPPMYKSSLSLCLFLPLLETLNCNKENHCIKPTTFLSRKVQCFVSHIPK